MCAINVVYLCTIAQSYWHAHKVTLTHKHGDTHTHTLAHTMARKHTHTGTHTQTHTHWHTQWHTNTHTGTHTLAHTMAHKHTPCRTSTSLCNTVLLMFIPEEGSKQAPRRSQSEAMRQGGSGPARRSWYVDSMAYN